MKVFVRRGKVEDVPWMMDQLREFQVFFGSKKALFSKEFGAEKLKWFINNGLVFVAEKETKGQIGLIIGAITPHLFNPNVLVLAGLFWWVDPNHRTTEAGHLLLREFVDWGKANVDWITFSLLDKTPVKESTLKRFGFRHLEACYLIEVGCENGSSSDSDSFVIDSRHNDSPDS